MSAVNRLLAWLDNLQQDHRLTAFSLAVIKKYNDDQAGQRAALLTYYGFLSLFPLILVVTTLAQLITANHSAWQTTIINSVTNNFPVLGNQLATHVHSLHRSGLALLVGLLFTIYGTRGLAGTFRDNVNDIWQTPPSSMPGFPKNLLTNLSLIIIGGLGFIATSVIAGLVSSAGHDPIFRLLSAIIDLALLFALFSVILNLCLPRHVPVGEIGSAALSAAIGLVILQLGGSYLLKIELSHLDAVYSYFALALGLLFWIYLQAQILYYAVEIAAVHSQKLWPRSLTGNRLTAADTRLQIRQHHVK